MISKECLRQKCELLDLTLLLQTPHFSTDINKSFDTSNEAFVSRAINVIIKKTRVAQRTTKYFPSLEKSTNLHWHTST